MSPSGSSDTLATAEKSLSSSATASSPDLQSHPLRSPAFWLVALIAMACVLVSVSDRIYDPALWQHLAVGKTIWQTKTLPTTQQWTWLAHGAPIIDSSWGFQALLWPLWSSMGVAGLYLYRWLTTLLAFGLLWMAARRMGASGLTPLFTAVLGSLLWRERAQVAPEMLAGVLLALELWILERRRSGGRDASVLLVPVAWAWSNVHLSSPLFFLVLVGYLANDLVVRKPHGFESALAPNRRRLWIVAAAALAIVFVNPFGWRGPWQPFDVFLHARDDVVYRAMLEMPAAAWLQHWKVGFPILVVAWPLLLVWRWWRKGFDLVEVWMCAWFTWIALALPAGTTFYALVMVPFVARDLDAALASVPRPSWTEAPLVRAALVGVLCVLVGLAEWSRPDRPLMIAIDEREVPVRAADFVEQNDLRGRMFNHAHQGGYLAYRFWPARDRLPFMDVPLAGTRQDRMWYSRLFSDPEAWGAVDRTYLFDIVVLDASQHPTRSDWLKDKLDADTTWTLVFLDDGGAVYLRRSGRYANLARRLEYIAIPAGEARLALLGVATERDSMLRQLARIELQRQIAQSPFNARAHSMIANLDIAQGDFVAARRQLEEALRQNPLTFAAHERLGMMAMASGRAREALAEFELEKRLTGGTPELPQRIAQARAVSRGGGPPPRTGG